MPDTAPAVYTVAVLVTLLYSIDFVVQWRNVKRSWKYTYLQLFLMGSFVTGDTVFFVYNQREARTTLLHGLQGMSLLQSLMIEAMISSRLYVGPNSYFDRRRTFPWVHSFICIVTVAFCILAFTLILRDKDLNKGCVLVLVATNVSHAFLTCLAFQQHKFSGMSSKPTFLFVAVYVSFVALSTNTLLLLLPSVTAFLLGQTIISFVLSSLWVSLITYNYEWKKYAGSIEHENSHENSHENQGGKSPVDGLRAVGARRVADVEMQTPPLTAHGEEHEGWSGI